MRKVGEGGGGGVGGSVEGKQEYCWPASEHFRIRPPSITIQYGKVCIRAKWPIRTELIPVSVA